MNTEVQRLLSYMAAFAKDKPKVAKLMDQIANAPSVGAAVTADRGAAYNVKFPTAQLALQAVEYAQGGSKPEWLSQAGVVD